LTSLLVPDSDGIVNGDRPFVVWKNNFRWGESRNVNSATFSSGNFFSGNHFIVIIRALAGDFSG
jgi:hypothetical protein